MAADHLPPRRADRLIDATSPYLLQHAHNPVDWYPWGPEALERARRENKPIFLSIGYSACHWCHVMEREVFEDEAIAALMNEHFINIKVDREERPDLDEIYMLATQVTTGSGGWPMSLWLTPELEPFYAGTYFPPTDSHGRPGFPRLELALAEAWRTRPDELRGQAAKVVAAVRMYADESEQHAAGTVDLPAWLQAAVEQQADRFDEEYGGFGTQPKFPPSQALLLWLELLRVETPEAGHGPRWPVLLGEAQRDLVAKMLTTTLDAMHRGGIYDHVGGAFARYSTDRVWLVPHFEKMLYDNAQLALVYARAAVQLGRPDYERVARQTLDFYLREMTAPGGGIFSTLDADSAGVEGQYYVWTLEELRAAAGDDADLLIRHCGVTAAGNWPEGPPGGNVLHIAQPVAELAPALHAAPTALQRRLDAAFARLRGARQQRVRPGLDDKILTGWNGLMISALAVAGRLLHEPRYLEAAHRAIGHLLLNHMENGRHLLRVSRHDVAHIPAFLEDHAFLLNGLMDLIAATTPTSLPGTMARRRAPELADTLIRAFEDPAHGGFFFTTDRHDQLLVKVKNATDGATPSASAVAIRALFRLAQSSGRERYRHTAMRAVQAFAGTVSKQPGMFATLLNALVEDARFVAVNPHVTLAPQPPGAATGPAPALLTLRVEGPPEVPAGAAFALTATLAIAAGYHIQLAQPPDREAFATTTRLRSSLPIAAQAWEYPAPHAVPALPTPHTGYTGTIVIRGTCTVAAGAPAGAHTLRVSVLAQPCGASFCLAPERASAELTVQVTA